ncbi:MAG TPA: hypothetical protein VN151_09955 [Terracidiphilus sp.]|jgi:hypothetical protein|nr:hypothetical protein [Terracidiphilus sp.]
MNFDTFTLNCTATLAQLPTKGLFLFLAPLLFLVAMKLYLSMRTGSAKKTPTQWINSGEYDENGLPMLARAHSASDAARYRAAMAAYQPRKR